MPQQSSNIKIAIMQPYFFPYLGYWQLISAVDKFVVFDDVNYIKRGWINRNRILLNGKDYLFTLPLKGASQNKLINEIEVDGLNKWVEKFVQTIEAAYKKAPQYISVFDLLCRCFEYEEYNLSAFVTNSIKAVCSYLYIKTEIIPTSTIYDTRELKKDEKILSICRQEKATGYINPAGGQELYDKEKFLQNGIELSFLKMKSFKYRQFDNEFIPALSIIDVLMFNEKEEVQKYLLKYELL